MRFDHVFTNLRLLSLDGTPAGDRVREGWVVAVRAGRIAALGPQDSVPPGDAPVHDLGGRLVTPGLVDCHTHLVFAGDRSGEWARRMSGESYADIARAGGGIQATVRSTREATENELVTDAARRLALLADEGVSRVEIKSGYGLDPATELRMLRAARRAGEEVGVPVTSTLLAAHAVPPEYAGRPGDYLDDVCIPLVRTVARDGLADAVDAFLEDIAFSEDEVSRLFRTARDEGLPVRLHADQLDDGGGAALAARFGALSADHLEYTSHAGVRAMAEAGTVAVLLPGAWLGVRETRRPPVADFRAHDVPMAVATDANPGSSPLLSLLGAAHLSCALFGLTVAEALRGVTVNAARALGLAGELGSVAPGLRADLAVWDVEHPAALIQWIGARPLHARILGGALAEGGTP